MELAASLNRLQQGRRLTLAAISAVYTIGYVASLLGEDEEWLHDVSVDMFPEDGCLYIYGIGDDGLTAFTEDGIENLRQAIVELRKLGTAPPRIKQAD